MPAGQKDGVQARDLNLDLSQSGALSTSKAKFIASLEMMLINLLYLTHIWKRRAAAQALHLLSIMPAGLKDGASARDTKQDTNQNGIIILKQARFHVLQVME